ncbi:MAG: hypothetical protein COB29_14745, partial [Sulfitobacter sp.]
IEQPLVDAVRPTTTLTYTALGLVETTTAPDGVVSRTTRNAQGQILSTIQDELGLAISSSMTRNAVGDVATSTDPLGRVTTYTYDANRRVTRVDGSENRNTETDYDADGRVVETRTATDDPLKPFQVATATYSVMGDKLTATGPDGHVTHYAYDELERQIRVTDAENRISGIDYDAMGQVLAIRQAVGTPIEITSQRNTYDLNGNILTVQDARNNSTSYIYDGYSRLSQTDYPDGTTESNSYDTLGNVLQFVTRAGKNIDFAYDALNRLKSRAPQGQAVISYSYDIASRLTLIEDTAGQSFDYGFDSLGRMISVIRQDGLAVSYEYDLASNRTKVIWPDAYFAEYRYDAANRVDEILENGLTSLASYSYDRRSRRASVTLGNGTSTSYIYEHDDDLSSLDHGFVGSGVTYDFAYNKVGQQIQMGIDNAVFSYVPVSNTATSYTVNNLNQYTAIGSVVPSYDGTGNMSSDGFHSFVFDTENRLVSATSAVMTASYAYDPHGRRASKTVDSVTTAFLLDGAEEIADYDGAGQMLRRYVYGPGIDEPLMMQDITNGGSRIYFHQDALGSVAALSDETGTVLDTYIYGPYGETANASGSPYRFTGRRLDAETGLYYYRARYYSPAQGRFLSPDPIGYGDGMNVYAYVGNDPINFVDPSGLFAESAMNVGSQTWNFAKNNPMDTLHSALDGAGLAPGVGIIPDLASFAVYAGEAAVYAVMGDWNEAGNAMAGAGTSLGAAIPVLGQGVTAAKWINKGLDVTKGVGSAGVARTGKNFTPKTKRELDADNAARNDGVNKCVNCGVQTVPGQRSQRGVTPPGNERQRDHIIPKSKGGDGTFENGQILCRICNINKRDNF